MCIHHSLLLMGAEEGETGTLHNTPPTPPVIIVLGIIWETLLHCSIQLRSGADNPSNVCKAHVLAPLQLLPLVGCLFVYLNVFMPE